MRRCCARIEQMMDRLGLSEKQAQEIHGIWTGKRWNRFSFAREPAIAHKRINAVLGTSGVEYLGAYYRDSSDVHYCNAGDTYRDTIIFIGDRLIVGAWGDMIEQHHIKVARWARSRAKAL